MIDPLEPLLLTALSRIAEGSLGAAGSQLWEELKNLLKRRKSAAGRNLEAIAPDQAEGIEVKAVATALAEEAAGDPQLRSDLESWQARVQLHVDGDVSNSVTGEIHGKVVQARDIGSLRIE